MHPYIVGLISQKGGVGKSTLARLLAREVAAGGLSVKIADTDLQQKTSVNWASRRAGNDIEPAIRAECFSSIRIALNDAKGFDVFIFDGAPHASKDTKEIAQAANLVVIPTALGLDDLDPSILLAHDLVKNGIDRNKIVMALVKVTDSENEIKEARRYITDANYRVLEGELPVRTAYSKAHDEGRAVTETPYKTLAIRADKLAQSLVDAVTNSKKQEAA